MTMLRLVVVSLLCSLWSLQAQSSGETENWLFLGADGRRFGPISGAGGSVLWLRKDGNGGSFSLGANSRRIAKTNWSTASVGKSFSWGDKLIVSGNAEVGGGDDRGEAFRFRRYGLEAIRPLGTRLSVHASNEYIRFANVHGNIVKTGAILRTSRRSSVGGSISSSVSGNLNTRWASGEVDFVGRKASLRSGAAVGQARPEVLGIGTASARAKSLQQYFAGLTISSGAYRWTFVVYANRLGSQWQPGAGLTLRIPLSKPR